MVNQFFPFLPDDDTPDFDSPNFFGQRGPGFGNPNFPGQGGPGFGIPSFPGQMRPPGFPGQGPPSGFPGQGPPPGFPGQGRPPGGQSSSGPPTGPPPSFVPQQPAEARGGAQIFAVDPGAIRGCLFRFTYVWLRNGRSFWFYPTYVGRQSIAGFRWNGRRWNYYGTDLNRITSFQCF
ncbi:transporter [Paenisporosarcina antarctica]|uniref:Transporter n=1 Tax=Paenisporosarcina antarctica TaxID=417367 RepID=A0A4P7A144_9BACL|nr:transporter [Paenisporosarcina antarctica]QBP42324.1 transporter [Paenisporosarcina antarctica]